MFFPLNSRVAQRVGREGMQKFSTALKADREAMDGPMIVGNYTKMACFPEHYSGREANTGDLNHDDLNNIHRGVKEEHGEEAAKQFCQMVYEMPNLAATPFLKTFYSFMENGCKWSDTTSDDAIIDAEAIRNDPLGIGAATIGQMVSNSSRVNSVGLTESIRYSFVQSHDTEIKRNKAIDKARSRSNRSSFGYSPYDYEN